MSRPMSRGMSHGMSRGMVGGYGGYLTDWRFSNGLPGGFTDYHSRDGVAYRVGPSGYWEEVSADVPRLTYDSETGRIRGYLHEQSATNLIVNSSDFGAAPWSDVRVARSASLETDPFGGTGATKLAASVDNNTHRVDYVSTTAVMAGEDRAFSVFAKEGEYDGLALSIDVNSPLQTIRTAIFDLANGVVSTEGAEVTAKIERFRNGWYRCSITASLADPLEFVQRAQVSVVDMNGGSPLVSFAGDGSDGIHLYHAQIEDSLTVTSPIPTSGLAVTRAEDIVERVYPELLESENVSLFMAYTPHNTEHRQNAMRLIEEGAASNQFGFDLQRNSTLHYFINRGDAITDPNDGNLSRVGETLPYRMSLTYDADRRFVAMGAETNSQTNPNEDLATRGLNQLQLGNGADGIYERIIIDDRLWTDEEAIALAN